MWPAFDNELSIIYFCPFCGTRLQTKESVDEWVKKFPTKPN
jgi:hypothetical protein